MHRRPASDGNGPMKTKLQHEGNLPNYFLTRRCNGRGITLAAVPVSTRLARSIGRMSKMPLIPIK
jgi:hypothetical protein